MSRSAFSAARRNVRCAALVLLWTTGLALPLFYVPRARAQERGPRGPRKKVKTVAVETVQRPHEVEVTGTLTAKERSVLSFRVAGVVSRVLVEEGDFVAAGQTLAELDDSDYLLAVRQAEAQLAAAEAQARAAKARLAMMQSGFRKEEIAQAEAALKGALAQLTEARKGFRTEDVKAAEAGVAAAQSAYDLAAKDRRRMEKLHEKGAVSKRALDAAVMQERTASAQLEGARWRLSLLKAGLRPEQVEAIEAAFRRARSQVELLKNGFRKEDVAAAGAAVEAAEAQVTLARVGLDYARQQLAYCKLKAPFDGVVTAKAVSPGTFVVTMMRSPVVELRDVSTLNAVLEVPDKYALRVKVGQEVVLDVDGGPSGLHVKVGAVGGALSLPSRKLVVKAAVKNDSESGRPQLKPGMFVRGRLLLEARTLVSVPREAVLRDARGEYVMVVKDGIARRVAIKAAGREAGRVLVEKGLSGAERVIPHALGITDGQKVEEE